MSEQHRIEFVGKVAEKVQSGELVPVCIVLWDAKNDNLEILQNPTLENQDVVAILKKYTNFYSEK